ncbi:MAG: ABC transporter permease, partial [Phycisphaerales bacterium]|nr:ABC transporter permease [Phycisphaerales bacterium]
PRNSFLSSLKDSMTDLITRRLLQALPLLLLISIAVFALIHLVPGGPLTVFLSNPQVRPEDIARLERSLGLDRPVHEQYFRWLANFAQGDWGFSYADGRPVLDRVRERIPATVELMGTSFLLAGIVALPLGTFTALRRRGAVDRAATLLAFVGISMPVYWLALMFQLTFGLQLGWLPISGRQSFGRADLADHMAHLIMPACVLAVVHIAVWSRYLRSSMIDALAQPYMITAQAKGLSSRPLVLRHALRNALLPLVTIVSMDVAFLLSGAVITESIFAWPGIGSLFVDSIFRRDYTVVMGVLMIGAASVVFFNLVADVLCAVIDPRIRYGGRE